MESTKTGLLAIPQDVILCIADQVEEPTTAFRFLLATHPNIRNLSKGYFGQRFVEKRTYVLTPESLLALIAFCSDPEWEWWLEVLTFVFFRVETTPTTPVVASECQYELEWMRASGYLTTKLTEAFQLLRRTSRRFITIDGYKRASIDAHGYTRFSSIEATGADIECITDSGFQQVISSVIHAFGSSNFSPSDLAIFYPEAYPNTHCQTPRLPSSNSVLSHSIGNAFQWTTSLSFATKRISYARTYEHDLGRFLSAFPALRILQIGHTVSNRQPKLDWGNVCRHITGVKKLEIFRILGIILDDRVADWVQTCPKLGWLTFCNAFMKVDQEEFIERITKETEVTRLSLGFGSWKDFQAAGRTDKKWDQVTLDLFRLDDHEPFVTYEELWRANPDIIGTP